MKLITIIQLLGHTILYKVMAKKYIKVLQNGCTEAGVEQGR
jgi:hypothetical protein